MQPLSFFVSLLGHLLVVVIYHNLQCRIIFPLNSPRSSTSVIVWAYDKTVFLCCFVFSFAKCFALPCLLFCCFQKPCKDSQLCKKYYCLPLPFSHGEVLQLIVLLIKYSKQREMLLDAQNTSSSVLTAGIVFRLLCLVPV